jgi:hypothetical protein
MKHIAVLLGTLLFTSPLLAETPCDLKGISVGSKMSPAELMSALGVAQYKTNPARRSFNQVKALAEKYGLIAATEIEDWEIGPYCDNKICRVPYGVAVGNNNSIPVKVDVSFHEGLITEIVVSFSETYWDEMLPIFDQKYGADWTIERNDMPITNYETKEARRVQTIFLQHVSKGTNLSTKDHCQISAINFDMVFEHHDAFGPYHSNIVIKLISKNF